VSASLRFAATAIAAAAVLVSVSALADVPVWRVVKGDYSEHEIMVDPRIVGDPRLAFLLEARLKTAEDEVRDWDEFARDAIREKTYTSPRETAEETLHLLGITDRYAAILMASAECSGNCHSGEFVTIYRLSEQKPLKSGDVLKFDDQIALLNHLVERDENLKIGPYSITCDQSQDDSDKADEAGCLPFSEILYQVVGGLNAADADQRRFKSAQDIVHFAQRIYVGFTTDTGGHVTTLDIYFSYVRELAAHPRAYKWSIDAKEAAPLFKPALRDLVADAPK
jgi:hypothetical protein